MSNATNKRLLNVNEAANYLSISRAKLYQWSKDQRIKSLKIDSRRLFDIIDLDSFIASLKELKN